MAPARAPCALAVVVLVAGCGARVQPGPSGVDVATGQAAERAEIAEGAGTVSPGAAPAPAGAGTAAQESVSPGAAGADAASGDGGFDTLEDHNEAVRVFVGESCVRPGEMQRVRTEGPPRANLGLIVGYSDGEPHGAMTMARSDDAGQYVWRFLVAPDAPAGAATVLATSTGQDQGDGGGTAHGRFRVAGPDGC